MKAIRIYLAVTLIISLFSVTLFLSGGLESGSANSKNGRNSRHKRSQASKSQTEQQSEDDVGDTNSSSDADIGDQTEDTLYLEEDVTDEQNAEDISSTNEAASSDNSEDSEDSEGIGEEEDRKVDPVFSPFEPVLGELEFETIEKQFWCDHQESKNYVITNKREWEDLWNQIQSICFPKPAPPEVDFDCYMAIAVFQGWCSTGGYAVEITKIIETEDNVVVFGRDISPGKGCIVTQAITSPYHIVKVPKVDKRVIFRIERLIWTIDGKLIPAD